ncbi:MAG TPA: MgtC/SapB family protein [Blastocatellia bacterium]|nr:MgtC/SapB family protein [Blastocatellia bacterium]
MEISDLFQQLGIALGLGLLVGLQRESASSRLAGVRTFPLVTILGTACALLAQSFGGWEALAVLAGEIEQGASAVITADGGGLARAAKVGAVALSAATGAPLLPVGAACRPAIAMPHKWDAARNPVPLGRVAIATGESLRRPVFDCPDEIETARLRLQGALDEIAATASRILCPPPQQNENHSTP